MNHGICALCKEHGALRNSHIIPNSVFRRIKQSSDSGQLIQIDDSAHEPVQRSQDSWREPLLCHACEQDVSAYEQHGLETLRGRDASALVRHDDRLTLRAHDYGTFKLFLTSILWRAAVSRRPEFSKVILPPSIAEEARQSLRDARPLNPLRLGCIVSRLIDRTSAEGRFTSENIEQLVISPIPRLQANRYYTFIFVIEGFLLEYFVPGVPYKRSWERGVHRKSPSLLIPYKDMFDVPELLDLLVAGYRKHYEGLVTQGI